LNRGVLRKILSHLALRKCSTCLPGHACAFVISFHKRRVSGIYTVFYITAFATQSVTTFCAYHSCPTAESRIMLRDVYTYRGTIGVRIDCSGNFLRCNTDKYYFKIVHMFHHIRNRKCPTDLTTGSNRRSGILSRPGTAKPRDGMNGPVLPPSRRRKRR
jgi:hypothetical protein